MIDIQLDKTYQSRQEVIQLRFNCSIKKGSFTAISGKSGAGKTTLLRIIAGLEKPDKGFLKVDSELWYSQLEKKQLMPQKRKVGMVFQEPALFPNMSVIDNLKYASTKNLNKVTQLTEIEDLTYRKINQLSGGQKQRVALARALVQEPQFLLLDEPFSALDNTTRYALQQTLLRVHQELGLTTLMVTHNQSEILRLADHMILIEQGAISKQGKPLELMGSTHLSGKFQFQGELVELKKEGVLFIASVIVGNQLIQVVLDQLEADQLSLGDQVIVASKAFNPIIKKIVEA